MSTALAEPPRGARRVLAAVEGLDPRTVAQVPSGRSSSRIPIGALLPTISLADPQLENVVGDEEVQLLTGFFAECRLLRANLKIRLQRELHMSPWGAEECARRITARVVLAEIGLTDPEAIAKCLHTTRKSIDRDARHVRQLGPSDE